MVEKSPQDAAATERLMRYWAEGAGAAKLNWGSPGDFDACVREMHKHGVPSHEIPGLCANLHHRATGAWPGHAPGEQAGKDSKGKS